MKQKIYFLINEMGCGGAQRVISEIVWKLKDDFDITILTLMNYNFGKSFYDLPSEVELRPLSSASVFWEFMIYGYTRSYFQLKKLIKQENNPLIISFLEFSNFLNIVLNKNPIISFRTTLEFFKKERSLKNSIYLSLIKKLYPYAKKIIVNSAENKRLLSKQLNIKEDKIQTIYNPIDLTKVNSNKHYIPEDFFIRSQIRNSRVFISIGRLDKIKNFDLLIKSFRIYIMANPINKLIIVGEGPERKKLEQLIKDLKLENNVFLVGSQNYVIPWLKLADYFVFASETEGFPNVLIEAMAVGLPIITSDFKASAREIISPDYEIPDGFEYQHWGSNGILINQIDFEKGFENAYFNLERIKQGKVGIERFNIDKVAEEWKKLIQQNLKK